MKRVPFFGFLKYLWGDFKKSMYDRIKCYELAVNREVILAHNLQIKAIENLTIGEEVKIAENVILHCGQFKKDLKLGGISIGNRVYIGPFCTLFGEGEIEIEDDCTIAPGTIITSQQHTYTDPDRQIKRQPMQHSKVVLEKDVWIGSNAIILPGIRIGRGSVIGAGAVVTKDIPPYSVAVGVPARVIKKRGNKRKGSIDGEAK